ncbi:MAG: formimidoylglutamase [Campylobacteraceae bacterium]|nr:formimidoylglutamase [Campylobacteraceae bacterium]
MYKKANKDLWSGRVDVEDKELGKRWHEKIQFINEPFTKKKGICLFSFDCDEGVKRNKGRVGAAKAGDALKKAMGNFAYHLENKILYDAGKVVATEDLEKSQKVYAKTLKKILKNKHFPLVLGGGHETAYGSFLALHKHLKEDIAIINFDAHFDLRVNKEATSGTPFAQIAALCKKDKRKFSYMCLGVSKASNTKALYKKAKDLNVVSIEDTKMNLLYLDQIKKDIDVFLQKQKNIYITIDTDVFSAYILEAVSAPASRGISLEITYEVLKYCFKKYKNRIKLLDITEFNPHFDEKTIGAKIISRLVFDIVHLIDEHIK